MALIEIYLSKLGYTDVMQLLFDEPLDGMCTMCHSLQRAEPDANGYKCDNCGCHTVVGYEQLVLEV